MAIIVRDADRTNDAADIRRLWNNLVAKFPNAYGGNLPTLAAVRKYFDYPGHHLYVAIDDTGPTMLGFLLVDNAVTPAAGKVWWVDRSIVTDATTAKQVGIALLRAWFKDCRQAGIPRLRAWFIKAATAPQILTFIRAAAVIAGWDTIEDSADHLILEGDPTTADTGVTGV